MPYLPVAFFPQVEGFADSTWLSLPKLSACLLPLPGGLVSRLWDSCGAAMPKYFIFCQSTCSPCAHKAFPLLVANHEQIHCDSEDMDPCFLTFREVDNGMYMLSPAQYYICLEVFLIRNKRLRKWIIIKMISLCSQVTQMQKVAFRLCFALSYKNIMGWCFREWLQQCWEVTTPVDFNSSCRCHL